MKSFAYHASLPSAYSEECWTLQQEIHQRKGRFEALRKTHATHLEAMRNQALLDNVDASARIDGIYLEGQRIKELLDGCEPLTTSERQIVGYARTLKAFQKEPERFPIDAATFLAMHTVLMGNAPSGKKSSYRQKDHVNMMIDGQVRRVPASPIPAFETPLYLGSACDELAQAFASAASRRLLMIPTFIVDVMCIKPFDAGTGRMTRLFAQLLLEKAGFDICRYLSMDRLMEERASSYYEALNACLETWDGENCDYSPFVALWLETLASSYEALFALLEQTSQGGQPKAQQVKSLFARRGGQLSKQDVIAALPDVSISTIENALGALVKEGYLEKLGRGRATTYRRLP